MRCRHLLLLLPLVLAVAALPAQPKAAPEVFTDPAAAGPDFVVQGEYEGDRAGKGKLAAQVVAEGKGKFLVVFLPGGLPGAGWDGKTRLKSAAQSEEGKTAVAGGGWKAVVAEGKLTGTDPDGDAFALRKVERHSPTEGRKAPEGGLVLFDGTDVKEWTGTKLLDNKLMAPGGTTKRNFRDFQVHVEFILPFKPAARGQERGNSGVYLQRRYEIQILDSFGLEAKNNDCGAVYEATPPDVPMCYPPLAWQTYDIDFTAARYDPSGKKVANAVVSVVHNGVKVHDRRQIAGSTGFGIKEEDSPKPINLQNHGNPVYFRNVWVVPAAE